VSDQAKPVGEQTKYRARKVAILASSPVSLFELGCATELFATSRPDIADWYHGEVINCSSEPLLAAGGLTLQVKPFSSLAGFDDVLIPYWPTELVASADLIEEIEAVYDRGGRVWSFCSGVFLLAQTCLLAGQAVTTHWRYKDRLLNKFPELDYRGDILYCFDDRIGCSAGSAAALDLGLEVVRRDYGFEIANRVAKRLLAHLHRQGGQSQFVEAPVPRHPDLLSEVMDWALNNMDQVFSVEQLAQRACMSRRSFDRKFRSALNQSPKSWLIEQRLNLARAQLERGQVDVEAVALSVGFMNAASLRHHFNRQIGLSPSQYRRQFNR